MESTKGTTVQEMTIKGEVRQFQSYAPDADLTDLYRRILSARWSDKETVSDNSQGVPLKTMRQLAHGTSPYRSENIYR